MQSPSEPLRNARQELFALAMGLRGMDLLDAYIEAGHAPPSPQIGLDRATALLRNPVISARIQWLEQHQDEPPEAFATTSTASMTPGQPGKTEILEMLKRTYQRADEAGQHAAAARALMEIGRELHGMFQKRTDEVTVSDLPSPGELIASLQEIAQILGFQLVPLRPEPPETAETLNGQDRTSRPAPT